MLSRIILASAVAVSTFLAGCAATVTKTGAETPMSFNAESIKHVAVLVNGSTHAMATARWWQMRQDLRAGLSTAALEKGVRCELLDNDAKLAESSAGTFVQMTVFNFQHATQEDRAIGGVMSGDAFINVEAEFYELPGKRLIGKRRYTTTTKFMEGILSAATDKQAQAIGREVFAEMKP